MTRHDKLTKLIELLLIALGVAIYTFGFVNFNMANALAEGGVAGITLILHAHFGINPAYSSLLFNLPLFYFRGKNFWEAFLSIDYLRNSSDVCVYLDVAKGSHGIGSRK